MKTKLILSVTSLVFAFLWIRSASLPSGPALTLVSPDHKYRAELQESSVSFHIDRNFKLTIVDLKSHTSSIIFFSPDEGRPPGTEKFFWSNDSEYLLLVGRSFYVKDGVQLANGEKLYLLYHVKSGKIFCNADQPSEHTSFSFEDIAKIDFGVEFKK